MVLKFHGSKTCHLLSPMGSLPPPLGHCSSGHLILDFTIVELPALSPMHLWARTASSKGVRKAPQLPMAPSPGEGKGGGAESSRGGLNFFAFLHASEFLCYPSCG